MRVRNNSQQVHAFDILKFQFRLGGIVAVTRRSSGVVWLGGVPYLHCDVGQIM